MATWEVCFSNVVIVGYEIRVGSDNGVLLIDRIEKVDAHSTLNLV